MQWRKLGIPIVAVMAALPALAGGQSLYREDSFRSLTADHRAYRLGDALTVLVFENSSATTSADTSLDKQGSVGATLSTTNSDKKANLTLNEDFAGKGRIQRSGKLLAQLTVNVTAVAPNGDLIVAGSQLIEVNDERQHILLQGRVRPLDISETNTVPSSRLADARISYVGDGVLAEKQHPGFLTRVLSWLGIL
jgi:flagellar L-ring protein precursor FlgH